MNTVDEMVAKMKDAAMRKDYYTKVKTICEAFGQYKEEQGMVYKRRKLVFSSGRNRVQVCRTDDGRRLLSIVLAGVPVMEVAGYLHWHNWEEVLEDEYEKAACALENRRVRDLLERFGELED